jgi:hypothetical protein
VNDRQRRWLSTVLFRAVASIFALITLTSAFVTIQIGPSLALLTGAVSLVSVLLFLGAARTLQVGDAPPLPLSFRGKAIVWSASAWLVLLALLCLWVLLAPKPGMA